MYIFGSSKSDVSLQTYIFLVQKVRCTFSDRVKVVLACKRTYCCGLVQIGDLVFRLRSLTSTPCRFFQSGPLPLKVYVFEEISTSTFQKYILFYVFNLSERIYS